MKELKKKINSAKKFINPYQKKFLSFYKTNNLAKEYIHPYQKKFFLGTRKIKKIKILQEVEEHYF